MNIHFPFKVSVWVVREYKNVILVRSSTIVREYCYFLSDDDEESNCGIRNLNGKSGRNEARAPATASKSESLFGEWPSRESF